MLSAVSNSVIGAGLAVVLLCFAAAGLWLTWRRPFVGLGVLVGGMAFHNFALMVLLALHTPAALIRVVQGWKELVLVLLSLLALRQLLRARASWQVRRLIATDWIAIAFAAVLVGYLLLPSSVLPGSANFLQRLAAFRTAALIPLLYALGRIFSRPSELALRDAFWLIVGAGAVVGAFGLYELGFVPSATWLVWGVSLFSSWLGFTYNGPAGLPANFFQSLPDGLLLRRMVSTYISPLGIAYTGLLAWPIAVVMLDRPSLSRRVLAAIGVAAAFLLLGILYIGDPSFAEHLRALAADMKVVSRHVLGTGLGGSVHRFVQTTEDTTGAGESAVLGFFGDVGVVGGVLYVALYALAMYFGLRAFLIAPRRSLAQALPLVASVGGLV